MRALRIPEGDYEVRARCRMPLVWKDARDESARLVHGAADMDAFRELERRLRCTDCGERPSVLSPSRHACCA